MPLRLALSAVLLLLLALIAFWPQYLSKFVLLDPYRHAYTFLGFLWLLVLIAQPLRFRTRSLRTHRLLGRAAIAVGARV